MWAWRRVWRNNLLAQCDRKALTAFAPDVVLCRHEPYYFATHKLCRQLGVPVVTYADAPAAYEARHVLFRDRWHPPRLLETIERYCLASSRAVVTISDVARQILLRYRAGVPVHAVSNGVSPERFPQWSAEERVARRRARGLVRPRTVVFQGSFQPFHDVRLLGQLMLATASRHDVDWLIIGDGRRRAELEACVSGRVPVCFAGRVSPKELGELMTLADISVVPYERTADEFYLCPLKVLESAAAGCATIAPGWGDIPKLLDEGRAGVLLEEPTLSGWQQALTALLEEPVRCGELGHRAREFVTSRFTWHDTAVAIDRILREAIGMGRRELPAAVVA